MITCAVQSVIEDVCEVPDPHGLITASVIDALETAILGTVENEATWLETQLALLRRALLVLRPISSDSTFDPRAAQVLQAERTLRLVTEAIRMRLSSLSSTAAALHDE